MRQRKNIVFCSILIALLITISPVRASQDYNRIKNSFSVDYLVFSLVVIKYLVALAGVNFGVGEKRLKMSGVGSVLITPKPSPMSSLSAMLQQDIFVKTG